MALKVPRDSTLAARSSLGAAARKRSLWIVAVCALACAWMLIPVALAQHSGPVGGGHAGGGRASAAGHPVGGPVNAPHVTPPHAAIPPAAHPTFSRPPVPFSQRAGLQRAGFGPRPVGFGPRPIFPRHRIFVRGPFFRFAWSLYPGWWLNCGPSWVWGFGCGDWRPPEYVVENYIVPPPLIYEYPVYVYGGDHEFVELFLKDGTVYSVADYWFVNDDVHFTVLEEGGTKSAEQVIGLDELDLQKTVDVNTRRGFLVVRRDEPLEQYLRDHPDANAPLLEPRQKN